MTCGDMVVGAHPDRAQQRPEVEPAYLLLCISCHASLGGSCGTEGTWRLA